MSGDKFYLYFKQAVIIFKAINTNTTRNIVLFYRTPGFVVNCHISLFFSPMLEIHFDRFAKELALKLLLGVHMKYIGTNLVIIFISYNDFEVGEIVILEEFIKELFKEFLV